MESTFPRITCFNPRICKRCDVCSFRQPSDSICFNPRICKRCDCMHLSLLVFRFVSIHASVKDATRIIYSTSPTPVVSIHASVKDATGYYIDTFLDMDVSIHASVKDATKQTSDNGQAVFVSIHASVKDATSPRQNPHSVFKFQSTHL